MTERTYKKSPSVAVKKKWIELYYQKNISVQSIADDYNYPVATVYRVITKLDPNRKERSDKGKKKSSPLIDIDFNALMLNGESYETQIEILIQEILRGVAKKKNIKIEQALQVTNRLMDAMKKLRSVQLGAITKNLDVKIVEGVVRKFKPDATPLQIIEIVKKVIAELKASKDE